MALFLGFEVISQNRGVPKMSNKERVIKSNNIEVSQPCLLDNKTIGFKFLVDTIPILHTTDESPELQLTEVTTDAEVEQEDVGHEELAQAKIADLLSEANAEASAILVEARRQADELLENARVEIEEKRRKAEIELENLLYQVKEEVTQQAQADGYEQGLLHGQSVGKELGLEEANTIKENAEKYLALTQRAFATELSKVDTVLVKFAIQVAERIVNTSLSIDPNLIINRMHALTLLPEDRDSWKLYISSQDAEVLSNLQREGVLDTNFFVDESLSQGDCYLECPEGRFDANIKTQLDRFEKLLREDLANAKLG